MFKFVPYILKSLWGHRTRSILTLSGVTTALFIFCFIGGIRESLNRLNGDKESDDSLIVFQIYRFCPETSRLPQDYEKKIAEIPGVEDVLPMRIFMNNCRATLKLVVFHGVPAEKLRDYRDLTLLEGDWDALEERDNAAIIGRKAAQEQGIELGDDFTLGEVTVHIVGIFSSPKPVEERLIYTQLNFLQYTRGLNSAGIVTQFEVKVAQGANPEVVARAIDETFRTDRVPTDTRLKGAFEAFAVGDLTEVIGFANYLGYACVILVLTIVSTTTTMAVQDRIKEHAVLQTLGFTSIRIFQLVIFESIFLSFIGGAIGVGVAMAVLAWGGFAVGTEGINIEFQASFSLAMTGLLTSLLVGGLAGLMPAARAASAHIVDSLNNS
jgi:putative ABC transport system permease protein